MEIDVNNHISEVLYNKDQVSIPGLGGFEANYQSAIADQVQGKMSPPTKQLVFKKVPGNDNFLIKHIKDQHNISYADAQKVIEDYVVQVQRSIENKEIIVFPNIGRLYKDYEQELRFLPDKENFNKASYGLPEVELFPALRDVPAPIEKKAKAAPITEEVVTEKISTWFQRYLIPIIAVAITLICFGLYTLIVQEDLLSIFSVSSSTVPINESPSNVSNASSSNNRSRTNAPPVGFDASPEEAEAIAGQSLKEAIEKATPPEETPKPYSATIQVETFSNSNSADLTASSLIKEGYNSRAEKFGQSWRVVITIDYTDEEELDQILSTVKKKISASAEILKRGLKSVE